ncbi:DUF7127 family protein [Natronoarchaeum rubrum]|uniref:DUF7127 family protein n=1 Tax=Natronoarchaeum rubrum TaxID=755311 RepID=UPI002111A693|nr:hypothetical protein [Natronoarchaeum rubrum]
MEMPPELEDVAGRDEQILVTERDHDGGEIAVDFGPTDADATVDVVGDTAIVVIGDRQFEFPVPEGASDVTVNAGVLTIRD